MNCTEAQELLSAYFDGELSADLRASVAEHLQTCADCSAALSRIRSLSTLAKELPDPIPGDLWPAIESHLGHATGPEHTIEPRTITTRFTRYQWKWAAGISAVAAVLLVGAFIVSSRLGKHDGHTELAINLSHYVDEFCTNPSNAQRLLHTQYPGKTIQPDDAIRLVNYKPLAPEKLPSGLTRSAMYLFEMPCCKCVESVYQRPDGGMLAVFEHVDEQPAWFGKRPSIQANCNDKEVSLIQCDGQLGACWKQGERYVTLVGVKELNELGPLLAALKPDAEHSLQ